jgi:membrane associated rhomboid family serine protease
MGPVNLFLILANVAVFGLELALGDAFVTRFALWPLAAAPGAAPAGGEFHAWQLVTSAFLHAGVAHLGLNMFALYIFGRGVEQALGSLRYLVLYAASLLSAALTQLVVVTAFSSGPAVPTVGASGAAFGVLLAFAVIYPRQVIVLLFPPIPMPAWLFATLYAAVELANGVLGTQAGVAHFAHLGGMVGSWLALRAWRSRR